MSSKEVVAIAVDVGVQQALESQAQMQEGVSHRHTDLTVEMPLRLAMSLWPVAQPWRLVEVNLTLLHPWQAQYVMARVQDQRGAQAED